MAEAERPTIDELKNEVAALAAELREMLELRVELARLELTADAGTVTRLALRSAAAAILGLAVLPLLLVAAATQLDGCLNIATAGWLLIEALASTAIAGLIGYFAWRRFRRDFRGLAQSIEECHEDLVWLRERTGS